MFSEYSKVISLMLCRLFAVLILLYAQLGHAERSVQSAEISVQSAEKTEQAGILQGMSVMGNSEQPKVLYLVPWQPPSIPSDVSDPPPKTITGIMPMMNPLHHTKQIYFRKHLKVGVQSLKTH